METIKTIFRIGYGPSSSHTMGPRKAAGIFLGRHPGAAGFRVTLYGSLAATGRGHLTDAAIGDVLHPHAPVEIVWRPDIVRPRHTNGMLFEALDAAGGVTGSWEVYSVGGGALASDDFHEQQPEQIYGMSTICDIQQWCERNGSSYWE